MILADEAGITPRQLPENLVRPTADTRDEVRDYGLKRGRKRFEADLIRRALDATAGNRTHAARLLEISHRALLYKIKEYGLGD